MPPGKTPFEAFLSKSIRESVPLTGFRDRISHLGVGALPIGIQSAVIGPMPLGAKVEKRIKASDFADRAHLAARKHRNGGGLLSQGSFLRTFDESIVSAAMIGARG